MQQRVLFWLLATSGGTAAVAQAQPIAVTPASIDALAKAIDANPDDSAAYDAYALAAFQAQDWDAAIGKLKVGVARIATYREGYYKLAYAFRKKSQWADAADYYRRYIEMSPTKTDPYYGLGISLAGLGDKKGAIAAYEKYVALETNPAKQRFVELARAELLKLDPSRAPAAPTENPEGARLAAEAEELVRSGQLRQAVPIFQQAITADPNNAKYRGELGNTYFSLKHFEDAASSFRAGTEHAPNDALGWYNLARALRNTSHKADAVTAFQRYISMRPDDPDPYYGLGQTYKAIGDKAGAREAFNKYIEMEKRPEEQKWVEKARAELPGLLK